MSDGEGASALVVGVGEGLGKALCQRFARGGLAVAAAARRAEVLQGIAAAVESDGGTCRPFPVDARDEAAVAALFDRVEGELGPLSAVVYNAGANVRESILDLDAALYRKVWDLCCFAGFLVGREAARRMAPRGRGSILFTGATASMRGGAGFAAFAGGKFALRALAQSMARELQPRGIHVAHVVVDGVIDTPRTRERFADRFADLPADGVLQPGSIAETFWQLHCQPRDAWAHEVDLRPWVERF